VSTPLVSIQIQLDKLPLFSTKALSYPLPWSKRRRYSTRFGMTSISNTPITHGSFLPSLSPQVIFLP